jgi:hypothetical protein
MKSNTIFNLRSWYLKYLQLTTTTPIHCIGRLNSGMYQRQMQYVPMEKSVNMECEINKMHWDPTTKIHGTDLY